MMSKQYWVLGGIILWLGDLTHQRVLDRLRAQSLSLRASVSEAGIGHPGQVTASV
jgi:hypothetical protein